LDAEREDAQIERFVRDPAETTCAKPASTGKNLRARDEIP